jgi:hypothetical protein
MASLFLGRADREDGEASGPTQGVRTNDDDGDLMSLDIAARTRPLRA